ncbi:MAG: CRISPR-associated endoribonuclease Cas6 [Dysgonamonadaceae bacterium]|nr:CRISPR-associated endoribonuclease Cas6 [Dysgonamonadaceae bacterium]
MNFKVTLYSTESNPCIPVNYQYPMSAALYRVIAKGDAGYAAFLHGTGYGKGFKFFTFSQIDCPFNINKEEKYMKLRGNELSFRISFHLPEAMENFIKGLFQSERIDIADKKYRASFVVKSVERLPDPLQTRKENEIVSVILKPNSMIVSGIPAENGKYEYLSPDDPRFVESLIYNWRSKIATCYGENTAQSAILLLEILPIKMAFKPRLITIKADTPEESKVRGWLNFELKVIAEKRFIELLLNAGVGLYNPMCGGVEVV